MASPFKWFRKNQKAAFVVLTLMAMISFIVLPAILQYMGGSGGAEVTFATTKRYGKVDGMKLNQIMTETTNLAQFYEQLALEIGVQYQMQCYNLERAAQAVRTTSQDQAVEQWLIVQYMRDQGFNVSREDVGAYLSRLTFNPTISQSYATESVYRNAVKALGSNDRNITYLVGNRILLEQFYGMSAASVGELTPVAEFDWYNRFNRRMKIEAIPVSVSDFTAAVAAPTKKESKKFFEDKKFHDRNPASADSGFSIPAMIQGEYVYYDKDMLNPDEVTDEEIEKYYEENKELFAERPMSSPGFGGAMPPGATGTFISPETSDDTTETVTEPEQPNVEAPAEPTIEAPIPADVPAQEPVDTPVLTETPAPADTPVPEPATQEPAPAETPAPATDEAPAEPTSWNIRNVPIRLVSYQTEEQADVAVAPETDAAPAEQAEQPATDNAPATDDAPAVDENATEPQAQTGGESSPVIVLPPGGGIGGSVLGGSGLSSFGSGLGGTTSPFGQMPIPNMGNMGGSTNPALTSTPVTYRPLDDALRGEIREMIARQKMNEKLKQVQDAMNEHYKEYIKALQQNRVEPLPNIASLAESLGLKYADLGSTDYFGLLDKHFNFAASVLMEDERFTMVSEAIFQGQGTVGEKRAALARDWREGTEYLFWITKYSEPRIPNYDEEGMAEQVEARWRMVEARSPAKQKAEELAETAKKAEGSFVEYFTAHPNNDVKTMTGTEFFTWMTPSGYTGASFGEVCESGVLPGQSLRDNVILKNLGNDFMQTVYNLEPGQVTVAHNEPQDTFYVVRMVEVVPTEEAAFDAFALDSPNSRYLYRQAAMQDRGQKLQQGALKKITEEAKFVWKVKPSEYQQIENLKAQERQDKQEPDRRPGGSVPPNVPRF